MSDQDDNVCSFAAVRFDRIGDPAAHLPAVALEAAAEWLRNAEDPPEHIIVLVGRTTEDGASATKFFQAGKFAHHAQQGLLMEGAAMMRESKESD